MAITYPLFVFEKDDKSMSIIEDPRSIFAKLEAIDIENDEYIFWDANGNGVTITVMVTAFTSKLNEITSCGTTFPIREAFISYAKSLGIAGPLLEGRPIDVWQHIQVQANLAPRRGKSG